MAIAKYKIPKSERRQISSKTREEKKKRRNLTVVKIESIPKAEPAKVIQLFSISQPRLVREIQGIRDFGQIFRNWPMDGGYRGVKDDKF